MESFHTQFRYELLNQEIFTSLRDAQVLIEAWRRHCHTARPHSALRNRPPAPAPETMLSPSRPCANLHPEPIGRGWSRALSLTEIGRCQAQARRIVNDAGTLLEAIRGPHWVR